MFQQFLRGKQGRRKWLLFLLLMPYLALLWPPLYNFDQPELFQIPFFYWFQLLWLILTAAIILLLRRLNVDLDQ